MISRKIANKINSVLRKRNEVDKKGKSITVHYTTINNYLKIRNVFYMSNEKKRKGSNFTKGFLE